MVRIVLDLHDERHAVLGAARKAPVTNVRVVDDGVQLAQVTARKPHVYTVPNNGSEHVFFSCFSAQRARLDHDDHRNAATAITNTARIVETAADSPRIVCVAAAPPMSVARHTAAMRVRIGAMPMAIGTTKPIAPSTSATPRSLIRSSGTECTQPICGLAASCAFDRTNFIVPAAPKASARKIWIPHMIISILRTVTEQLQFHSGCSAM